MNEEKERIQNNTVLELYKIHVEMADRVSQRRGVANNWFITIHASLISAMGILLNKYIQWDSWEAGWRLELHEQFFLIVLSILGIALAFVWRRLINSYRKLNEAKFEVILKIEKNHLPLQPYTDENKYSKKDKRKDFSAIEKYMPNILIVLYLLLAVFLLYIEFIND